MSEQVFAREAADAAREAELRAVLAGARDKLNAIKKARERGRALALVGKCYAYRNSYSCPKSSSDYWTLYLRVVGVTEHGNVRIVQFQVDKDGRISIEEQQCSAGMLGDRHREISHAKLLAAWDRLRHKRLAWFSSQLLDAVPLAPFKETP